MNRWRLFFFTFLEKAKESSLDMDMLAKTTTEGTAKQSKPLSPMHFIFDAMMFILPCFHFFTRLFKVDAPRTKESNPSMCLYSFIYRQTQRIFSRFKP
jgi:hypothetical protein